MKTNSSFKALGLKNDEELRDYLLKILEETAERNGKNIYSVSLEDIYQALTQIRNSWYGSILKKITLSQFIKVKKTTGVIGDSMTLASSASNPLFLSWLPAKRFLGKKITYVTTVIATKWFAKKVYKTKKKHKQSYKP